MTTLELEEHLSGGGETQRIEFKGPMGWEVSSLAKDILALSNVQDGGFIIIGVADDLTRAGVSPEQQATFSIETMRDQMSGYADPHINITVSFPQDSSGVPFVAIHVREFEEIPVLCRRDGTDVTAGTLYYRNRNRRVESAPISNSNDMRDVLTRAAVKLMRKLQGVGLQPAPVGSDRLNEELEGL